MSSSKKKKILLQLTSLQLKNIEPSKKFTYRDIMRITKHINKSIFGKQCTLWDGFVANIKENKSPYINFYFRGKKLALHRLLYINYVEDLKPNEFIKYSCKNKGKCCCLNHMIKYVKENDNDDYDNDNYDDNDDNDNNDDDNDDNDDSYKINDIEEKYEADKDEDEKNDNNEDKKDDKTNNIKELNKVNSKQENKKETNNKNKSFLDKISKFTICFD